MIVKLSKRTTTKVHVKRHTCFATWLHDFRRDSDDSIALNALISEFAATTLCALHYMACSISIWITQALGGVKKVALPLTGGVNPHTIPLVVVEACNGHHCQCAVLTSTLPLYS